MAKYWQFFRMGFQQFLEYRLNFVWSTIGTVISTVMLFLFWQAIIGSHPSTGPIGFSLSSYYLLMAITESLTFCNFRPISEDIWEGDLVTDLLRPYNYLLKMFIFELPYKIVRLVVGILLILAVSRYIDFQITPYNIMTTSLIIVISTGVRFFLSSSIGGLAFWFNRVHGFNALFFNLGGLFSGSLIPLVFLPTVMNTVSLYLPFRYITYLPVQTALGQIGGRPLVLQILTLSLWFAFIFYINSIIWKRGLNKFEAHGR